MNINLIVGIIILVIVVAIVAVFYVTHTLNLEKEISTITSIVTIGSLIIAPLWYFIKRNSREKSEKKRISINLYYELEYIFELLNSKELKNHIITNEGKKIHFINAFFNHDVYDSLVISGQFNFLEYDLQQPIQSIFKSIKFHNDLTEQNIIKHPQDNLSKETNLVCARMEKSEERLKRSIPEMMNQLKTRYKIEINDC